MAVLANIAAVVANVTPLCVKLIDFIASASAQKKTAREEAQRLLFNVYRELKANFAVIDPIRQGAIRPLAPNGQECKAIAAKRSGY
jgi:hypothetical protein